MRYIMKPVKSFVIHNNECGTRCGGNCVAKCGSLGTCFCPLK